MKKFTLVLSLAAGTIMSAQAQTGVRLGIKAGATLSNFMGEDVSNVKYKFGGNAGLMANFKATDALSFQVELLYSMKGARVEGSGTVPIGSTTYSYSSKQNTTLHYLDIPLLVKANVSSLFFEAGPQLGFLIGQHSTYDETITGATGSSVSNSDSSSSTDGLRKVDVGYILGVGYQLSPALSLGARYNGGFTSIADDGSLKARNGAFQVQLGYLFGGQ